MSLNPITALSEQLQKLINERGSSAILRDHLAMIKDQVVLLEKENATLKEKVLELQDRENSKNKVRKRTASQELEIPNLKKELFRLGVTGTLPNRYSTTSELETITSTTRKIKFLAISGLSTRVAETKFSTLRMAEIKCLLLSPDSGFAAVRQGENPSRSLEGLKNHIRSGLDLLYTAKLHNPMNNFEIKTYDEHPVYRMVIIDDLAYVSYYPIRQSPDEISVFVVKNGESWLYQAFEKYFDSIWNRGNAFGPQQGDENRARYGGPVT